jgi:hypothetical protein
MATISLANYTGAEIARIARNIITATVGYGVDERKSFSVFTVNDATGQVSFTGPDGVARTINVDGQVR